MTISVIVKEWTTNDKKRSFTTASAKGKYLQGAKRLTPAEDETTFDVKFCRGEQSIPSKAGIYDIECSEAWRDVRPEVTFPTIRVKGITSISFKAELKPLPEK